LQLSAANLLLAGQQAVRPGATQPAPTAAAKPEFASLDFKQMLQQPAMANTTSAPVKPAAPAQTVQRMGSQLDIRV
jgi:hypothetical protein